MDDEREELCFISLGEVAASLVAGLIPVTEANCVTDHDTQHAGCRGYGETEGEDEKSVGEGHGYASLIILLKISPVPIPMIAAIGSVTAKDHSPNVWTPHQPTKTANAPAMNTPIVLISPPLAPALLIAVS